MIATEVALAEVPAAASVADQAETLRSALLGFPTVGLLDVGPADLAALRATADRVVVGELVGMAPGQWSGPRIELPCEREEGVPSGEMCVNQPTYLTVRITVADPSAHGGQVDFEILVGDAAEGLPRTRSQQAVDAAVAAAPVGARLVAFLTDADGVLRLAHPSGWALVDGEGALHSLAVDQFGVPGLGGASTLAEFAP